MTSWTQEFDTTVPSIIGDDVIYVEKKVAKQFISELLERERERGYQEGFSAMYKESNKDARTYAEVARDSETQRILGIIGDIDLTLVDGEYSKGFSDALDQLREKINER